MRFSALPSSGLAWRRRYSLAPVSSAPSGQIETPPLVRRAGRSEEHVPGWGLSAQIRGEASGPHGNWGRPSPSLLGLTVMGIEKMPPR